MRKLATIRRIDSIRPIPEADAIECAVLGGWVVVVKKGEFAAGDLAVYCEIDSWIPHELAPFLSKGQEPREFEGIKGERLRTVKLRGQISQGLLFSLRDPAIYRALLGSNDWSEGQDVTELLGIVKYEPPIPAQLAGEVKGPFPGFIPKTDQERIQNLAAEFEQWQEDGLLWEITEKLDGSSMTVYIRDGEFGVCSRNLELRRNETNSLWRAAVAQDLEAILERSGRNLALQGELIGEGIQGNPYKIKGQTFRLFDIYDIDQGRHLRPEERSVFVREHGISTVPVLIGSEHLPLTLEDVIRIAEGKSQLNTNTEREGLVYKCLDQAISFKAISNKFLIKTGG